MTTVTLTAEEKNVFAEYTSLRDLCKQIYAAGPCFEIQKIEATESEPFFSEVKKIHQHGHVLMMLAERLRQNQAVLDQLEKIWGHLPSDTVAFWKTVTQIGRQYTKKKLASAQVLATSVALPEDELFIPCFFSKKGGGGSTTTTTTTEDDGDASDDYWAGEGFGKGFNIPDLPSGEPYFDDDDYK